MPLDEPPDDPVLLGVLESGEFEYYLRIGSRGGGGTATVALLEKLFPLMSAAGKSWLLEAINQSIGAAQAMQVLGPEERLDQDVIPRVPSRGILDALPGDVVALNHATMPGQGRDGVASGIDTTSIMVVPPTVEELAQTIEELQRAAWGKYELGEIPYADLQDIINSLQGIYQIS